MATQQDLIDQSRLNAAVEAEELNLFSILKPKLSIDGNQWCVLYGDDLQVGVAGFGDSPMTAIYAFNKAWYKDLADTPHPGDQHD